MKNIFLKTAIFLFTIILLCGCPAELKITPNNDNTYSVEFKTIFGEKLTATLKDLSDISAQLSDDSAPPPSEFDLTKIIDAKKIENELNLRYLSQSKIQIQENIANSYKFIANAKTKKPSKNLPPIIIQKTEQKNGKTRLSVNLGAEILQKTLLQDKTTLKKFADVLMAPLVTGEEMTSQEYQDLLIEIYGETVTQELLSGNLKITIAAPDGKTVSQTITIAELLVISSPQSFVFEY